MRKTLHSLVAVKLVVPVHFFSFWKCGGCVGRVPFSLSNVLFSLQSFLKDISLLAGTALAQLATFAPDVSESLQFIEYLMYSSGRTCFFKMLQMIVDYCLSKYKAHCVQEVKCRIETTSNTRLKLIVQLSKCRNTEVAKLYDRRARIVDKIFY